MAYADRHSVRFRAAVDSARESKAPRGRVRGSDGDVHLPAVRVGPEPRVGLAALHARGKTLTLGAMLAMSCLRTVVAAVHVDALYVGTISSDSSWRSVPR